MRGSTLHNFVAQHPYVYRISGRLPDVALQGLTELGSVDTTANNLTGVQNARDLLQVYLHGT